MTNVRVENLKPGDRVDLLSCPYLKDYPSAEFEWAVVDGVVQETDDCIRIMYEDIDWVGYPIGTILRVRD
jgi:hypothetical protein